MKSKKLFSEYQYGNSTKTRRYSALPVVKLVTFVPELATSLSVNEAIVLQRVHFLIGGKKQDEAESTHFHEGKWWINRTYEIWCERDFPFWSLMTVKRTFTKLVKKGYLLKAFHSKNPWDRTSWYTVDYDKLDELL